MSNSEAPNPLTACEYGDYGGTINVGGTLHTCGQWMDTAQGGNPANCYSDTNYEICCGTCDSIASTDPSKVLFFINKEYKVAEGRSVCESNFCVEWVGD